MNNLHDAYNVLGLEHGASMEAILRRYKQLILTWHPDRASTLEHKRYAEEELKKINNAKDILIRHFQREHRPTDCYCQPKPNRTAAENPDIVDRYNSNQENVKTNERPKSPDDLVLQLSPRSPLAIGLDWIKNCSSSWRLVACLFAISLIIDLLSSWRPGDWWRETLHHGHEDKPMDSVKRTSVPVKPEAQPSSQWYRQGYYDNQSESLQQRLREQKRHDENIYFTRLDIDTWHRTIENCNADLTQLELKISDPSISESERQRLIAIRERRKRNLFQAKENLESAQRELDVLTLENNAVPARPEIHALGRSL